MSKEKIEKAKERLSNPKKEDLIEIIRRFKRNGIENYCIAKNETLETLLQYIKELEADNYECNNIINNYIDEMNRNDKIIDEMVSVIIASNICKYFIKDNCKHYAGENKKLCDECIKQYFEKKVEEE